MVKKKENPQIMNVSLPLGHSGVVLW